MLTHANVATTRGTYVHLGVEDLRAELVRAGVRRAPSLPSRSRFATRSWSASSPWLRPEFAVLTPELDDPVLAGERYAVADCDRPTRSRRLCAAHHGRWAQRGRPEVVSFIATAAPVRAILVRADEVFDLSALPTRCRLELALVLQQRHDERGRGLRPLAVRPVVVMIAASGAGSLLERHDWHGERTYDFMPPKQRKPTRKPK